MFLCVNCWIYKSNCPQRFQSLFKTHISLQEYFFVYFQVIGTQRVILLGRTREIRSLKLTECFKLISEAKWGKTKNSTYEEL